MANTQDRSNDTSLDPVQCKPLEVKVYGNFDKAFKIFKAMVQKERILSLWKEKQFFEKPSDKKRRKRNEAKRREAELQSKYERMLSGEYEKKKNNNKEEKEQG